MPVDANQFQAANRRARRARALFPPALSAFYCPADCRIHIDFAAGVTLVFDPLHVPGLAAGSALDFQCIQISPSGHGLHFPSIDADVFIPALLLGNASVA
jgi:Protein of unknown function (DUF2442)